METATRPGRPANGFDHLRLLAALTVLVHHQFYVYQRPWSLDAIDPGAWAVGVFFAISGYLNTRSLLNRRSVAVFFVSRACRLYPALILCVGLTVMLGALVTTQPLADYFGHETLDYFRRNAGLFFGQRSLLPGVFERNPVHGTNASLWTLPVEACFYVGLALAGWALRFRKFAVGAGAVLLAGLLLWMSRQSLVGSQIVQPGLMFLTGALMATLDKRARGSTAVALATTFVVLTGCLGGWLQGISVAVAIAAAMIGRMPMPDALCPPTDISYGLFLFAFPIQQVVVLLGFEFYTGLILATALTIALAAVSAHIVEIPALALAERLKRPIPFLCAARHLPDADVRDVSGISRYA